MVKFISAAVLFRVPISAGNISESSDDFFKMTKPSRVVGVLGTVGCILHFTGGISSKLGLKKAGVTDVTFPHLYI